MLKQTTTHFGPQVATLINCAPSPEEEQLIRDYTGEFGSLGAAEQFFKVAQPFILFPTSTP